MYSISLELVGRIAHGTSGLELLKTILNSFPFLYPIKLNAPDFVNILARYLIHLDESELQKLNK